MKSETMLINNDKIIDYWKKVLTAEVFLENAILATKIAALINASGICLHVFFIGNSVPGLPVWVGVFSALVGIVIITILNKFHDRINFKICAVLFLTNTFTVATALFILDPYYITVSALNVPFQANKLGCFVAAMLAPNFAIGLVCVLAHMLSSLIQYYLLSSEGVLIHLSGEPWAIYAFGLAAICVLVYRLTRIYVERDYIKKRTEADAIKKYAQDFIYLKDLMNTPLQVIEIAAALHRAKSDQKNGNMEKIDKALKELRKINSILAIHEKNIEWDQDHQGFRRLEKRME